MKIFPNRVSEIGIFSIALIITFSFALFFYIQNITDRNVRDNLFEQQKEHQLESTESISKHIGSDLSLMIAMLDGLSNSEYLQEADLYSNEAKQLLREKYDEYSTTINRLFVLDKNDIMAISL